MERFVYGLLAISSIFATSSIQAAKHPAEDCLKNVSDKLSRLPNSGYNVADCKLTLKTSPFGAGFGIVGEATADCEDHISEVSVLHSITLWSVHFDPGSCKVASIAPMSAPPQALQNTLDKK